MSDAIVLWRMCAVWNGMRYVVALGTALLVSTLSLNIANIVGVARRELDVFLVPTAGFKENIQDTEIVSTYGANSIGLAAAFVSLASNFTATALVGFRFWCAIYIVSIHQPYLRCIRLHRAQYSKQFQSGNRRTDRTLVERFMMLLMDSGIIYTALWVFPSASLVMLISREPPAPILHKLLSTHYHSKRAWLQKQVGAH